MTNTTEEGFDEVAHVNNKQIYKIFIIWQNKKNKKLYIFLNQIKL